MFCGLFCNISSKGVEMKKILLVAIGAALAFTMAIHENVNAASKSVAVIWEGKAEMANRVAMGFLAKVRTLVPDLEVKQYRQLESLQAAEQVFRECENKMDGIVFLRSSGAQFLATAEPKVPCFFGGCNNPVELGVVKNLNAPGGKVTGVTYWIPYQKRFEIIMSLFPNTKSVGLLVEKGHPGGLIEAQGTREQCKRVGIAYNEAGASDLSTLLDGVKKLAGRVDLILIPANRLISDNMVNMLPILNAAKTPTFSFADAPVKSGAVAGVAADDVKLGELLAESVVDVLIKRKPISQVPVKMDEDPKISVNESMMKRLDLKFPEQILKKAEIVR
jgi:putative tryptophan/tyrosine transport system substrate-binding protein